MDFDVDAYRERIRKATDSILGSISKVPDIAIVLGSGLGPLADSVMDPKYISYEAIPGFPRVTVVGHQGRLVFGTLRGRDVVVMQGRFHHYEGHDIHDVVFPIRVFQALGIRTLILTNAAGGLGPTMRPGSLMLIEDHVGLFGESPLRGANLDEYGPRFCDMSRVYDSDMLETAAICGKELGLDLHRGVYCFCRGPQFETPAEIRMLRGLGVSAVGMSTVPEATVASHCGMKVLALSCITNLAAGLSTSRLNHEEVLQVGRESAAGLIRLLENTVERLGRT
jgi:purine-nucleoside phosphorylase